VLDGLTEGRIVRCKMTLVERKESSYWGKNQVGLTFRVVTGNDGDEAQRAEDKRFHEATPSGQLEFQTVNWKAAEGIEIGQTIYVDIIKAD